MSYILESLGRRIRSHHPYWMSEIDGQVELVIRISSAEAIGVTETPSKVQNSSRVFARYFAFKDVESPVNDPGVTIHEVFVYDLNLSSDSIRNKGLSELADILKHQADASKTKIPFSRIPNEVRAIGFGVAEYLRKFDPPYLIGLVANHDLPTDSFCVSIICSSRYGDEDRDVAVFAGGSEISIEFMAPRRKSVVVPYDNPSFLEMVEKIVGEYLDGR